MTIAHQHTAVLRPEREDMARRHDVIGLGMGVHRSFNCARPIIGRNTCRHTVTRLNRNSKGCGTTALIVAHHGRQAKLIDPLSRQRQANQTTALHGHKVDDLRGCKFSRNNEITFIFPIFIINKNNHPALPERV